MVVIIGVFMSHSNLLDELCYVCQNMFYHNINERSYIEGNFNTGFEAREMCLDRIFKPIKEHIEECKSCNGLSLAIEFQNRKYRSRGGFFTISCSCGEEWSWPNSFLTMKYKDMDFEDIIMQINVEIKNSNKQNRLFKEPVVISSINNNIPLKYKNAIMGLEVVCED